MSRKYRKTAGDCGKETFSVGGGRGWKPIGRRYFIRARKSIHTTSEPRTTVLPKVPGGGGVS